MMLPRLEKHHLIVIVCIFTSIQTSYTTEPDVDKFTEDLSDDNSVSRTTNCPTYFQALHEMIFQTSERNVSFNYPTEESAPAKMAFSYVVHDNPALFEILLHLTFRPYNSYCIYVDHKTTDEIKTAFQSLVECYQSHFPNTTIFLHPQPAEVIWGDYSLLNADLRCLEALYERNSEWDYYVNLAGTELPVTTVESLASKLSLHRVNISVESYFKNERRWEKARESIGGKIITSEQLLPPAPYNLQPCKGMKNVFVSRKFAEFAIHHEISQQFRIWLSFTNFPDESFFQSLARIKDFQEISPHNYNITLDLKDVDRPYIPGLCPRYSNWSFFGLPCDGKYIRWICHITLTDLKVHLKRNQLDNGDQHCYVINKVDVNVDTKPIHYLAQQLSSFVIDEHLKTYKPIV